LKNSCAGGARPSPMIRERGWGKRACRRDARVRYFACGVLLSI
jgi:hypothetical protein